MYVNSHDVWINLKEEDEISIVDYVNSEVF